MIHIGGKYPDGATPEGIFVKRLARTASEVVPPQTTAGVRVNRTTQGTVIIPEETGGGGGSPVSIKPYRLFDVQDDYLICLLPPTVPTVTPALGTPRYIGSFVDASFDADNVTILVNPDSDPQVKYTPASNDMLWNADHRLWKIFNGTAWINMSDSRNALSQSKFNKNFADLTDPQKSTINALSGVYVAKEYLHRTSLIGLCIFDNADGFSYVDGPTEAWEAGTSGRYNKIRHNYDGSTTELQRMVPPWTEGEPIYAIQCNNTGVTRPQLNADGTIKMVDGKPVLVAVTLHIYGRSCQWAQRSD